MQKRKFIQNRSLLPDKVLHKNKYSEVGGGGGDPQTLAISGNILSISEGNSVPLPNSGGGGVTYIEVTKTEVDTLISTSSLEKGAMYAISGVDVPLYGGNTIYLMAITDSTFSTYGTGKFYNPKYDQSIIGFGIWTPNGTYSANDTVIWGGKHWINLNGNLGVSTDIFTLDTEWAVIPFNEVSYNVAYDEIKYDFANDMIVYRNEGNLNVVSSSKNNIDYFQDNLGLGNPIKVFQWGNTLTLGVGLSPSIGIGMQSITNSLNENINFRGSYQNNLTFDNGSSQSNLTFDNGSTQSYLTFDNNSYQSNLTFDNNSYQSNLTFDNNSYQSNLTFDNNSYQDYLTFDNNSRQFNISFDNGSYQDYLTFDNGSSQGNLTETTGKFQNKIKLDNYTWDRISDTLTSNEENIYLTNYNTQIKEGLVAPIGSVIPTRIGEYYLDTVLQKLYISKGLANTDWIALN